MAITANDSAIVVRGNVHNTGERDGADVVQVYATLPDAEAPSRLIGFARVDVAAGAATAFEIIVPLDRLATRDSAAKSWRPASGRHMITAARFVGDADATTIEVNL